MNVKEDGITVVRVSAGKIKITWKLPIWKQEFIAQYFGSVFSNFRYALRLYEITNVKFNGNNQHETFEVIVRAEQENWLIKGLKPHRSYCVDYGILLSEVDFFPLLRSQPVQILEKASGELLEAVNEAEYVPKKQENKSSFNHWSKNVSTYTYYEKKILLGEMK